MDDPLMPSDVRRTKHIRFKMSDLADVGEGKEATANDFFNDDVILLDIEPPVPDTNVPKIDDRMSGILSTSLCHTGSLNLDDTKSVENRKKTREPRPLVHWCARTRHIHVF